jgi:hypothetical protein
MENWRRNYPFSLAVASPLPTGDSGLLRIRSAVACARGPPRVTDAEPRKKGEAMREHRPSTADSRRASPSYS